MTSTKTKAISDMEVDINRAIVRFEKESMGRGPFETRTYIVDDMIVVRLKGVLVPAELSLAAADVSRQTRELIKEMRRAILDRKRPLLEAVVQDIVGVSVESIHTDISTRTGERVIVFTLKGKPDVSPRE